MTDLTPMLKQYRRIKEQHKDTFLFFRLGDFYELFYEDAVTASRILQITLTHRGKGTSHHIPMCGVPFHSADSYIAKLVKSGHRVAICEQVEDPKLAKGIVKREVIRVITPGTITELNLLDSKSNNFIASFSPPGDFCGAAFIDLSTGDFRISEFQPENYLEPLAEQLRHFSPSEIAVPEEFSFPERFRKENLSSILTTSLPSWQFSPETSLRNLLTHFRVASLDGFGCQDRKGSISAGGALISYLKETQKANLDHIDRILPYDPSDYMLIDSTTRKNLEITKSLKDGSRKGTLISIIDFTLTSMGGRLLKNWILNPLLKKDDIDERLDSIEELLEKGIERAAIREKLRSIQDIERILTKIAIKSANPRDLLAMKNSLVILPQLASFGEKVSRSLITKTVAEIDSLEDIHQRLDASIAEEAPISTREGGIFKDGFSRELDELREINRTGKSFIASLEAKEKKRTGINSLKVRYNQIFGYYIEISRANLAYIPQDYIRKQTLVNAERFITPELKEYETKVLTAQDRIKELESELFEKLLEDLSENSSRIRKTAERIAVMDVLVSMAEAAAMNDYVRPRITEGDRIIIKNGRHPVVEKMELDARFVPNDTHLDNDDNQILIITGPNMGGKSTYLRQIALIVLMAQAGSFVPAQEAEVGLVDRIFTRVGASDFLVEGKSTFLVEMNETANILNNATSRSLIILDEIGRGTATFDGLSIAWAVVEYIHENPHISAKTLFATHYHELTELSATLPRVVNYNIAAKEWKDEVIFLHRLERGKADRSYGIQVAKLAGIPKEVIERAKEILFNLENNEFGKDGIPKLARGSKGTLCSKSFQFPLFSEPENGEIIIELREINLNKLTPLEALNVIDRLKKKIKE
ncbi:MAG: DNA mismatch repair protein MutS [Acidobacteriota bacterium]